MNKNILFIAPVFFDYYKDIKYQFKKNGYNVLFFDDRPSKRFWSKALIRISKKTQKRKIDKYVDYIVKETSGLELRLVFIILGQCFSRDCIVKIKKAHPEAKFIYYSWDSVANFPNILEFRDCFDKIYHFDTRDCAEYGFTFLPLYYSNDIKKEDVEYSFSAVFTVKRGKYKKFLSVMNLIPDDVKKNAFIYPYIQSKIVYLYYKLKYREFKNSKMKDFKYKKLPRDVFYKILAKSKAVVDVQMKNQSGLTMRTIEALHFEKKLITTNPAILEYEFYTDNNICVINKNHVNLPPSFFDTDFDTNYSIPKSYSLSAFVETIIQS